MKVLFFSLLSFFYAVLYRIPSKFEMFQVKKKFRAHHPSQKENDIIAIYNDQLEGELCFPLDSFIKEFLNAYKITQG